MTRFEVFVLFMLLSGLTTCAFAWVGQVADLKVIIADKDRQIVDQIQAANSWKQQSLIYKKSFYKCKGYTYDE